MKKIYIEPVCEEITLIFESELCKYSNTSGDLDGENYPGGNNVISDDDGPDVMHSKESGDFFEESITHSSIWGDED